MRGACPSRGRLRSRRPAGVGRTSRRSCHPRRPPASSSAAEATSSNTGLFLRLGGPSPKSPSSVHEPEGPLPSPSFLGSSPPSSARRLTAPLPRRASAASSSPHEPCRTRWVTPAHPAKLGSGSSRDLSKPRNLRPTTTQKVAARPLAVRLPPPRPRRFVKSSTLRLRHATPWSSYPPRHQVNPPPATSYNR